MAPPPMHLVHVADRNSASIVAFVLHATVAQEAGDIFEFHTTLEQREEGGQLAVFLFVTPTNVFLSGGAQYTT